MDRGSSDIKCIIVQNPRSKVGDSRKSILSSEWHYFVINLWEHSRIEKG